MKRIGDFTVQEVNGQHPDGVQFEASGSLMGSRAEIAQAVADVLVQIGASAVSVTWRRPATISVENDPDPKYRNQELF